MHVGRQEAATAGHAPEGDGGGAGREPRLRKCCSWHGGRCSGKRFAICKNGSRRAVLSLEARPCHTPGGGDAAAARRHDPLREGTTEEASPPHDAGRDGGAGQTGRAHFGSSLGSTTTPSYPRRSSWGRRS